MEDKKMKTYAIGYGGYEDRCVWYASSEEEVKEDYRKMLIDSGMEEDEIPSLEEIYAEELADFTVSFTAGVREEDEVNLVRKAKGSIPAGFHDSTDDAEHTYVTERFSFKGRRYLLKAYVKNWETDWGYDTDGEHGSFDIAAVEIWEA